VSDLLCVRLPVHAERKAVWTIMRKIDDGLLDELLKGCERPEDLLGDGGLMRDLKKALMQRMLGAELTEHLGYEHGQEPPPVRPTGATA
jgi:transposase-like protein